MTHVFFFTGLGNFRRFILNPLSLHLELVCILRLIALVITCHFVSIYNFIEKNLKSFVVMLELSNEE
jgi:hypothetical protein